MSRPTPRRGEGRGRRGQSIVEFALLLPLLALILVGTIDLGRVFFYYTRLTNAVRAGAGYGISAPAYTAQIAGRVTAEGALGLTAGAVTINCYAQQATTPVTYAAAASSCASAGSGDLLEVRAAYAFRPLTPLLGGFFPGGLQIAKSARMVIQ